MHNTGWVWKILNSQPLRVILMFLLVWHADTLSHHLWLVSKWLSGWSWFWNTGYTHPAVLHYKNVLIPLKYAPFPHIDIVRAMMIVWRVRGKIIRSVLCNIVCRIVHSAMHTHMNRSDCSLDWVLSLWAHFTVLRFIFVYVLCVSLYV